MKHLSDQELMRIVQAGDFSPASEIYDRYSSRIYNFAFRFLRNSEAAEDATQEVFVKMLKHANQFHGDAKLSTWLFSITANWCRDYLRKADNKPKESDDVLVTLPASGENSPDRNLEQKENEHHGCGKHSEDDQHRQAHELEDKGERDQQAKADEALDGPANGGEAKSYRADSSEHWSCLRSGVLKLRVDIGQSFG